MIVQRTKKGKKLRKALAKIGIHAKNGRKRNGYFDVVVAVRNQFPAKTVHEPTIVDMISSALSLIFV